MRANLEYDGVRLTRVMPFAWLVTAVLAQATHALAANGVPLQQPRAMSLVLIATFTGLLAIAGTMQAINHLREREHRIGAAAMVGVFLAASVGITWYGVWSYFF